ncbi:hypothetical protein B5807_09987 [Epicoccum nigrum]|uniref:Myb-like domain-containing protein n=1 Tax=Epicoccum nigrum TaxID=105696 RepID=A0A1Y2LTP5_EPING|nr:hypothetical protein B5807_09987 [Epicoccum nigrum]
MNEPLESASTIGAPVKSSAYRDTGIQTLPPPNATIYKLVYGRDPPAIGRPVMGIAAIGRFTEGPQSNPDELLHGAAYAAPTSTQKTYMDSEFQTESTDATRMALMKAKSKASIMANKYRKVALKEGYVISSATDNNMVIHSEQYATTVRLDEEGNLLEGSTKGRLLPNIRGTKSFVQPSTQPIVIAQVQPVLFRKPPLKIPALAPSSRDWISGSPLVIDNEYGSGKTHDDEFVVYDATSSASQKAPSTTSALALSRTPWKREDTRTDGQKAMGRAAAAVGAVAGTWSEKEDSKLLTLKNADNNWIDIASVLEKDQGECEQRFEVIKPKDWKPRVTKEREPDDKDVGKKKGLGFTADVAASEASAERLTNVPALDTATASRSSRTKRKLGNMRDDDKKLKQAKKSIDNVEQGTSHRHVENTPRPTVAPYVPPAMRANVRRAGSESQGPTVAPYAPPAVRASEQRAGSDENSPKKSPN